MKKVKLDNYVDILSGFAFKSSQFNDNKRGLPIVRIRNVKPAFSETYYDGEFNEKFLLNNGDILIGMDGEFNCEKWQGGKALLNQRVCRIKSISDFLDDQYLFYYLSPVLKIIEGKSNFVTVKHLSVKQIQEIKIPLPPIASQRRIANILDKADEIIRKRKEAIALTEQLQKSIFLDMFGDPVINPKGWEKVKLAKISNIQGGLQVTKKRESNPIEVPYLRVANAYRDSLNLNQIKTIFVTQQELNKTSLKKGDILIVEGHGNKTEIGRSCVWDDSISNCVHQNHLIRVRVDDNIAESIYVSNFLNSIGGRSQLIKLGKTTSGLNTINTSNVKGIEILLPPIKIQKKYITIQETIFQYIQKLNQQQKESENLFNSLLQKAFKGEL